MKTIYLVIETGQEWQIVRAVASTPEKAEEMRKHCRSVGGMSNHSEYMVEEYYVDQIVPTLLTGTLPGETDWRTGIFTPAVDENEGKYKRACTQEEFDQHLKEIGYKPLPDNN